MIKIFLKIIFSIILLLFVFKNIEQKEFFQKFSLVSIWGIASALLLLVLQSLFVSLRWKGIIKKFCNEIPFPDVVKIHYLSLGTSLFLPSVVAEPSIKSVLMKKYNISISKSILTVILDKIFVVIGLFLMTLAVIPTIMILYPVELELIFIYLFTLVVLFFIHLLLSKILKISKIDLMIKKLINKYSRFEKVLYSLIYDKNLFIKSGGYTFLSQVASITALYVLSLFMQVDISYFECLLLIPPALLVTTIPIAFNGWGIREVSIIYMLNLIEIPSEIALALSVQYGLISLLLWSIGLISWLKFKY